MNLHTFVADSPVEAVRQAREQLGPDAVVVNLRRVHSAGVARLWRKPRIELVACPPEPRKDGIEELRQELADLKQRIAPQSPRVAGSGPASEPDPGTRPAIPFEIQGAPGKPRDAFERYLIQSGLLPIHAARLVDEVERNIGSSAVSPYPEPSVPSISGKVPAAALELMRRWSLVRELLLSRWTVPAAGNSNLHIFVGPAGTGKTTVLCKCLSQAVLIENRRARVWRLDGMTANTAESLSIFAEILGLPIERIQPAGLPDDPSELLFIDLPGINPFDAAERSALKSRLRDFGNPQVHLVLNAAYEPHIMLAQAHAFADLPITDIVLSHTDEDSRWGKAWNLALGTNFSIRLLSGGQNIPGSLSQADPQQLLPAVLA